MPEVEEIKAGGGRIAYVVRAGKHPKETTFVTEHDATLQVGFIVKGAGDEVPRHDHFPIEREIRGTAEVLIVRNGGGEVDFYDEDRRFIVTKQISEGDVLVMLGGGHGFRFDKETVLLEVKQGPYPGIDEKERF